MKSNKKEGLEGERYSSLKSPIPQIDLNNKSHKKEELGTARESLKERNRRSLRVEAEAAIVPGFFAGTKGEECLLGALERSGR